MGWFRSKGRWASCCAIFALAVQLVLSFGHIHLNNAKAAGLGASSIGRPTLPDRTDVPIGPSNDQYCAICASLYSVGPLPFVALIHPLVTILARDQLAPTIGVALTASTRRSFQARAPPSA
jgi:hypothetical protein